MKTAIPFISLLILYASFFHFAWGQPTYTSVPEGGDWSNACTWIECDAQCPLQLPCHPDGNVNVIISGQGFVTVNINANINNLTVYSDGILVSSGNFRTLTVFGDIVNDGEISGSRLTISAQGNITNNGIWENYRTRLTSVNDQSIYLKEGHSFDGRLETEAKFSGEVIRAETDLYFRDEFRVNGTYLDMQENELRLGGNGNVRTEGTPFIISDGKVINVRDLVMEDGARLERSHLSGDMRLRGVVQAGHFTTFEGVVTVIDTLKNPAFIVTLSIQGNLLNEGVIIENSDGVGFRIEEITGNFVNNGMVSVQRVTVGGNFENNGLIQQASLDRTLIVKGYMVNNGIIRNNPDIASLGLEIICHGSVFNYGDWNAHQLRLVGSNPRMIEGKGIDAEILIFDENVIITGNNYVPNLRVWVDSDATLSADAYLYINSRMNISGLGGAFRNFSELVETQSVESNTTYDFYNLSAQVTIDGGIDTLRVTSYGHQVPETFAHAVRSWWKLESITNTDNVLIPEVAFHYDSLLLGLNVEEELEVFFSDDDGLTWIQISTPLMLIRDIENNRLTLKDVPPNGAYLLSSEADPVSVRPSVIMYLIGRDEIRVGPPNKYSIYYVNNSDISTGEMIFRLNTEGGVHIESVKPSAPAGITVEPIPIDILTFDGEDTELLLWVKSMASWEERLFDVYLRAYPDDFIVPKPLIVQNIEDVSDIGRIAAGIWFARKATPQGMIANIATNMTQEVWGQFAACESVRDAILGSLLASTAKAGADLFGLPGHEKSLKDVSEDAAEDILKTIPGMSQFFDTKGKAKILYNASSAAMNAKTNVPGCYLDDLKPPGDTFEDIRELPKVTSWDPNEKAAPAGYGEERFISSLGRMHYQIFFENVDTAQAPAWRVIIVDTLSDVFDPESVEFGTTSHEGEQFVWQMTREGNMLRWEIEDIELVPNVNPPEGEGYVTFSVMARPELQSGTSLRNSAEIIFDFNPSIITGEVVNTLDFDPPVTTMIPLPEQSQGPDIVVRWISDDDEGSGVQSVILYASKDGGGYLPVGITNLDSLVVPVEEGSTYSFYGLAKDNVGNVETVRPDLVETEIVGSVNVNDDDMIAYTFSLQQNYPNPFNPVTNITFTLPGQGRTTLRVYNILGQLIETLIDDDFEAGNYTVQWNAANVASGLYFYRLIQNEHVQVKRMVYVK